MKIVERKARPTSSTKYVLLNDEGKIIVVSGNMSVVKWCIANYSNESGKVVLAPPIPPQFEYKQ